MDRRSEPLFFIDAGACCCYPCLSTTTYIQHTGTINEHYRPGWRSLAEPGGELQLFCLARPAPAPHICEPWDGKSGAVRPYFHTLSHLRLHKGGFGHNLLTAGCLFLFGSCLLPSPCSVLHNVHLPFPSSRFVLNGREEPSDTKPGGSRIASPSVSSPHREH